VKIVKFDPKLQTLEDGSMQTKPKKTVPACTCRKGSKFVSKNCKAKVHRD
jgi:hypothetical protein